MTIIGSAAHLSMCECGGHGRVITAKGEASPWICSKEAARAALCQFAEKREVAAYEMGEALRQIDASPLGETDGDAGPINRITAKLFNLRELMACEAHNEADPTTPKWVN